MNKNITKEICSQAIEKLLSTKQRNGTLCSLNEEIMLLIGAMEIMHLIFDKNPKEFECVPPLWIISAISGRSINDFNYPKEDN